MVVTFKKLCCIICLLGLCGFINSQNHYDSNKPKQEQYCVSGIIGTWNIELSDSDGIYYDNGIITFTVPGIITIQEPLVDNPPSILDKRTGTWSYHKSANTIVLEFSGNKEVWTIDAIYQSKFILYQKDPIDSDFIDGIDDGIILLVGTRK